MTHIGMCFKRFFGCRPASIDSRISCTCGLSDDRCLRPRYGLSALSLAVVTCLSCLAGPLHAQDQPKTTIQVVSLDQDPDIDTWVAGVKERFEGAVVDDVRTLEIKKSDLPRGFASPGDWVFMAGHFTDDFWHHTQDTQEGPRLKVLPDKVTVLEQDDSVSAEYDKPEPFAEQAGPRYVFLRGCRTLKDDAVVQRFRAFFTRVDGTPPVLIGWLEDTGWQISQAALGGFGNKPPMPRKDFFDRLPAGDVREHDVIEAWLGAVAETFWGKGSPVEASASCIDSNGVEWVIKDDKTVRSGRTFE